MVRKKYVMDHSGKYLSPHLCLEIMTEKFIPADLSTSMKELHLLC
jgi:hypothetical protein